MLTWAIAWTIVNAHIDATYLILSVIADVFIVLCIVAAVTKKAK